MCSKQCSSWKVAIAIACGCLLITFFASGNFAQEKAAEQKNEKPIVHLSDAAKYEIPGGTCHLYPDSPTGRLSCALVQQKGRYPEKGRKVNKTCTEALFIIRGTFTVTLGDTTQKVTANDVVYIVPGTPYSLEGEGDAFVFIEPKWDGKQNTPVP